jgi:TolB-like protein
MMAYDYSQYGGVLVGRQDKVHGMVEEITTAISRLAWLFVIARNSAFTYKGAGSGREAGSE